MMEVKMFAEKVAEQIKEYLPEQLRKSECTVMEISKNNGAMLVGISCHMPDNKTAPVLYMESFYNEVQQGKPMEQVMKNIAECLTEAAQIEITSQALDMEEYKAIENYLTVAVVNTRANHAMLSHMPHFEIEDLSMICEISFPITEKGMNGSIKVTDGLFAKWGVTKEQVFEKAKENTLRRQPPELYSMENILGQSGSKGNLLQGEHEMSESNYNMYVLTNSKKNHGAAALAYPKVLEQIDRLFSDGYYIIPSSIHELIIVPKTESMLPQELGKMVREVNRTEVSREDILSDRIYEYDKETEKIRQVPESMEKRRYMER